jgi:undecaprenyl-diphosphatase
MKRHLLALSLTCLSAFMLLIWLVANGYTRDFDQSVMTFVQTIREPLLSWLMIGISTFGYTFVVTFIFTGLLLTLLSFGHIRRIWFALLALIGPAAAWGIKYGLQRVRPEAYLSDVYTLPASSSFPSGHVVLYTVLFGLIIFYVSTALPASTFVRYFINTLLVFLIATVGISRVYLGVHWPADVIGGYLLGAGVLTLLVYLYYAAGEGSGKSRSPRLARLSRQRPQVGSEQNHSRN